jgi:hypothetical protein
MSRPGFNVWRIGLGKALFLCNIQNGGNLGRNYHGQIRFSARPKGHMVLNQPNAGSKTYRGMDISPRFLLFFIYRGQLIGLYPVQGALTNV